MTINLKDLITLSAKDYRFEDRQDKTIKQCQFCNITPKFHPHIAEKILLRLPLPKIIVHQQPDRSFKVLTHHEYVETLLFVAQNNNEFEPRNLVRQLEETYLPLVIYESFMSEELVNSLIKES